VIKKSKLFLRVPIVILLLSYSISAHSQDILALRLDGSEQGKSLSEVLAEIENKNNAKFFFLPEWISSCILCTKVTKDKPWSKHLENLFLGTDLNFFAMYPGTVVIVKDAKQSIQRKEAIQVAIREKKTIEQYVLGDQGTSTKGNAVLKGKVIDSKTGDPLSQVNIYIVDLQVGAATDQMGNYSLAIEPGDSCIKC
jgi:hypothetical protein